jgi:hypothetical protein
VGAGELVGEISTPASDGEEEAQGRSLRVHLRRLGARLDLAYLEAANVISRGGLGGSGRGTSLTSPHGGYSRAMSEKPTSDLRRRMLQDMSNRNFGDKTKRAPASAGSFHDPNQT